MLRMYSNQDPHESPFSRLLRHEKGCWGPILTRILIQSPRTTRKGMLKPSFNPDHHENLVMPPEIEDRRVGAYCFCIVCPSIIPKNFNLGFNLLMVRTRALKFHKSIFCDTTFPRVPQKLTLWLWPWCLTYCLKALTMAISFEWYVLGLSCFTWVFYCDKTFPWVPTGLTCDLDLYVWPTY
jgi:hypothetical protein